ncbi:MAG: hypothetical protein ACI3ZP_06590 [Candidatus Cryptobacteroides sp.]
MDTNAAYGIFGRMMTEDQLYFDRRISFRRICRWLEVSRRDLNALVKSELGMTGQDLIRKYRDDAERRLRDKYAIKCFKL